MEEKALDAELGQAIQRATDQLPEGYREVFLLKDVEGLSYEEIATILDAKLGTVRSRIHRGRSMLRSELAHRAPTSGRVRYAGPEGALT